MDELFRTYRVTGPDCASISVLVEEDPPVPGFYMKLDPEFFVPGEASVSVRAASAEAMRSTGQSLPVSRLLK